MKTVKSEDFKPYEFTHRVDEQGREFIHLHDMDSRPVFVGDIVAGVMTKKHSCGDGESNVIVVYGVVERGNTPLDWNELSLSNYHRALTTQGLPGHQRRAQLCRNFHASLSAEADVLVEETSKDGYCQTSGVSFPKNSLLFVIGNTKDGIVVSDDDIFKKFSAAVPKGWGKIYKMIPDDPWIGRGIDE